MGYIINNLKSAQLQIGGRRPMRHFLITAATTAAFAALLASAPASADSNYGPTQNAGQCWKSSQGYAREGRFGYWGACPQAASVATTPTTPTRSRRHRR